MILQGNALHIPLADESVQVCVTSPPYFSLRNYSTAPVIVGGDAGCEHEWASETYQRRSNDGGSPDRLQAHSMGSIERDKPIELGTCVKCGAWRGHVGLERTHDCGAWARGELPCGSCYVCHLRQVAKEVWRVLRKDGVFFMVIGDSYAGNAVGFRPGAGRADGKVDERGQRNRNGNATPPGLKPKDLVGIPWRVALALQADGFYLRAAITWAKRSPMPESVLDRPTRSSEMVFMFTKSARYFYDAVAVAEPSTGLAGGRFGQGGPEAGRLRRDAANPRPEDNGTHNLRDVWWLSPRPFLGMFCTNCHSYYSAGPSAIVSEGHKHVVCPNCKRHDSWLSHYATFPTRLVETCIKAGTSEKGACPACHAPWERIIERTGHVNNRVPAHAPNSGPTKTDSTGWAPLTRATDNWQPACKCLREPKDTWYWCPDCDITEHIDNLKSGCPKCRGTMIPAPPQPGPCVCLDPFSGAGTVVMVAQRLGRVGIGLDLSLPYCQMAAKRIYEDAPLWA